MISLIIELALIESDALDEDVAAAAVVAAAFTAGAVVVGTAAGAAVFEAFPASYAEVQSIPMLAQSRDSQSTLQRLLVKFRNAEHRVAYSFFW